MWLLFLLFHSETYGEEYVEIEIGKKETRDGDSATMPISRFIKLYGDGDLYMVHNLPESMKGLLKSCCLIDKYAEFGLVLMIFTEGAYLT